VAGAFLMGGSQVNEILTAVIGCVVPVIEACGAFIIALEVVRTMVGYVANLFRRDPVHMSALRHRLGQSMVMGIEFQVAADILKTALAPSWNDILLLAALIGLRTVLNYLMERELRMLEADQQVADLASVTGKGTEQGL
jgi:uncharacterized membrane protein